MVGTFGRVDPHKGVDRVLEAFACLVPRFPTAQLRVIGPTDNIDYLKRLSEEASGLPVAFTGAVDDKEYAEWLAAVDVAVQLRPGHGGESSGAVVEVMAAGIATVLEEVGSLAEMARYGGFGVAPGCPASEIADRIATLLENPALRRELGSRTSHEVLKVHSPEVVCSRYFEAIEAFQQLRETAVRVPSTIYVDVTSLVETDRRTGIERVMARLTAALAHEFTGRVMPVTERADGFALALEVVPELLLEEDGSPGESTSACERFSPGDVLFSAEYKSDMGEWRRRISNLHQTRGLYVQVIHDLLPVTLPEFFPPDTKPWFATWLKTVNDIADLVLCDSDATCRDLLAWRSSLGIEGPPIERIRLASGLDWGTVSNYDLSSRPRGRSRVLMVGTVEPRKGVDALLAAAKEVGKERPDVEFVIVGRRGWMPDAALKELQARSESDEPLSWVSDASDLDLQWEYLNADLVVMPSRGEGFGLPIVEAVAHGVPVVARDLPVFRELLGDGGDYFILDEELPKVILERLDSEAPIAFVPDRLVTWHETARDVLAAIERHLSGRV